LSGTFDFSNFDGKITANSAGYAVAPFRFPIKKGEILSLVSDKKGYKSLLFAFRSG
jgi:hypothetical protein